MELYIIGMCIAAFFAYAVYDETQKRMQSSLSSNEKPKASDYVFTFFSLIFSLFTLIVKGGLRALSDNSNGNGNSSYLEKRRAGKYSFYGSFKIAGGLLPRQGIIGRIEVHFDGDMPKYKYSRGGVKFYETNGNVQVFFKYADDENSNKFIGETVDIYRYY